MQSIPYRRSVGLFSMQAAVHVTDSAQVLPCVDNCAQGCVPVRSSSMGRAVLVMQGGQVHEATTAPGGCCFAAQYCPHRRTCDEAVW